MKAAASRKNATSIPSNVRITSARVASTWLIQETNVQETVPETTISASLSDAGLDRGDELGVVASAPTQQLR